MTSSGRPAVAGTGELPVVVALGAVDPALVAGVLDGHCRLVTDPGDADLAVAAGAIARADARVDRAMLGRAPRLRVIARTGVGVDLVDVQAATARGVLDVLSGREPQAVADPAWRTHCPEETTHDQFR